MKNSVNDLLNRYFPVEGEEGMFETLGSWFGGPEDKASGEDNGEFAFGGEGSVLDDGTETPNLSRRFRNLLMTTNL